MPGPIGAGRLRRRRLLRGPGLREIRNPKHEIRKKPEYRNPKKVVGAHGFGFRHSSFRFFPDFGFRIFLAGYIRLPQRSELMPAQGLFGQLVVFDAQADDGFAFRVGDEGIKIIDVQLGFQQGRHELVQLSGGDFHHYQFAFGEREAFPVEHFARAVGVVHDHANDGAVGRVQDHQRHDMNALRSQQPNQVVEAPQPVGCEYGELRNGIGTPRLRYFCRHTFSAKRKQSSRGSKHEMRFCVAG